VRFYSWADNSNVVEEPGSALFTLGAQSVRITSITAPNGRAFLKVEGPHSKRACYDAGDRRELADIREQLEEALVAQGFARREPADDRRQGERRRQQRPGDRRDARQLRALVRPCPPDWASEAAAVK
jgi:hypothetical protein